MSKTRDTGFLGNVVKYDTNGNVTIVNGATTLLSVSSSGQLTVPGDEVITGSLTVLGGITGAITGSATSASYAANTSLLNGSGSGEFVPTGSFNTFSSSILTYTGSVNSQLSALQTTSGSNITRLGALESASGSAITRLGALEVTSGSNITRLGSIETTTGSLNTASGSAITRLNSIESKTGSYATTGSNTFDGGQYLSSSFNPTGFSTTASLYTDGGLRVSRDAYISGTLYLNNVTVFGTQSVAYISSSQLNIGTNLITVNTDTPSIRFGGLAVYDSGSTGLTGSLLWDSETNHWIYSNPSGSTYSGGMFISGPRTSTLGSETGTTSCMLLAGQGGDHLTSSLIYHSSTVTCIPNTLAGGVGCFSGAVCTLNASVSSCLGVGVSSPQGNFEVVGLSYFTRSNNSLLINPNYGGAGTHAQLQVGCNMALAFAINGDSEKMRLDASGNLMVGSLSAGNAGSINVSVGCAGTTAGGLQLWATNAQTHYVQFGDGTAGAGPYAGYVGYAHSTDTLLLGAGAATRAIISSAGVACFSSNVCAPTFVASNGIIGTNSNNLYLSSNSTAGEISFWGNQLNTRLMTILGNGCVGIGCSSPGAQLVVYGACNGDTTLHLQNGSVSGKITFSNNTANSIYGGGWYGYMGYNSATFHYFGQCIVANGDFNIGNTSFSTTGTLNKLTWTNLYPSTYNVADIGVQLDGNYYNGAIIFRTADADNANVLVERMRMESRGVTCFRNTVCAASFASPTPSLTRTNLNIDRATKVINSFNATASGARWLRVGCFNARTTYLMSFGTTGNYYTPGSTTFLMFRDWGNGFFTSTLGKLGEQYVFCTRFQSDNVGDTYALEVWMNPIIADQLNGVLVYSAATLAGNPDNILMCLGSYGTSLANAANTSTAILL